MLFAEDSLFRNATFLMASTAIMSVLGFVFWIFVAHLYSPSQIGVASALIAGTLLVSNLSMLGLNAGLVRFLPQSKDQSRDINAAMVTVGLVTIVAAAIYLLIGQRFGARIAFFTASPWHGAIFLILMAAVSLNSLTDAVFIANRRAEYHTAEYAAYGIVKLILPLLLVPFGSLGIFIAYIVAVGVSLTLSLIFMRRVANYRVFAAPNWNLLAKTRKYAANNYVGVLLAGLPAQIMPLIIIARTGSAQAAFFSMAWTMANLLYVVPSAIAQSLLAESSHNPLKKANNTFHAARLIIIILIPAVLLAVVIAPFLLKLFGPQYAQYSTRIFQLLAISTFFIAINSIGNTVLNIEHRSSGIIVVQLSVAVVTIGLANYLIKYGLVGVGWAMLAGNASATVVHLILYKLKKSQKSELAVVNQKQAMEGLPAVKMVKLVPKDIQSMLEIYNIEHFDLKDLGNGSHNLTLLVIGDNDMKVMRIYQHPKNTDQHIKQEISFLQYLSNKHIPVPRILQNAYGESVSTAIVQGVEWQYILMEYEPGTHPDTYTAGLVREMANIQAQIHVNGIDYAATYVDAGTKDLPISTRNFFIKSQHRRYLSRLVPKGVSHFDFDKSNILANGERVLCVLDFEGLRYDPLVVCIYFTLTKIYDAKADISQLGLYLKSYQQIRKLNFIEKFILSGALTLRYKSPKMLRLKF